MTNPPRQRPESRSSQTKGADTSPSSPEADLLWGINPVLELLKNRPRQIAEIIVQQSKHGTRLEKIITLTREHKLKLRFVPRFNLPGLPQKANHQGVVARITPFPTVGLDALLAGIQASDAPPMLLALDTIQDPHNLGAIIRSASAAGVSGVLLTRDRSAPLSGTVAKASAGSIAHVDLCPVTNLATALQRLKKEGIWIFGAAGGGAQSVFETDFSGPVCLVLGGEGKGIRPLVKKQCDFLVSIPMQGPVESLNVSVAAGIILFEIWRQRHIGAA